MREQIMEGLDTFQDYHNNTDNYKVEQGYIKCFPGGSIGPEYDDEYFFSVFHS